MPGHVFVCYDQSDLAYVRRLVSHFQDAGLAVWYQDEDDYGSLWLTVVRRKIDTCAAFVVVVTQKSIQSSWVDRQIAHAKQAGVPVVPLLLFGQWTPNNLHEIPFLRVTPGHMPRPPAMAALLATVNGPGPVASEPGPPTTADSPHRILVLPESDVDMSDWDNVERELWSPDIVSVAWSPDGRRIAIGDNPGVVHVWDLDADRPAARLVVRSRGRSRYPEAAAVVAWSPDGRYLATVARQGEIQLWDAATATERLALRGPSEYTTFLTWSPDSRYLATGEWVTDTGTVRIWDVAAESVVAALKRRGMFGSGEWSPDFAHLAVAVGRGDIDLWDMTSRTLRCTLRGHSESVWALSWSPDGHRLASASDDQTVGLWDVATRSEQSVLVNGHAGVRTLAWSPDNRYIAAAGVDGVILIWAVESNALVATLDEHDGHIFSVAWSPDGKYLASGGRDRVVRVWLVE